MRGYSQFNDTRSLEELQLDDDVNSGEDGPGLMVEDPAATVVQCANSIFLAIVQVKAI